MKDALDKALTLLARRSRTAAELDAALQRCGFDAADRYAALARVRELGYINDPETARFRARKRIVQGDAPRLAARKLVAQGIAEADARSAASEAADGADEAELAARALRRSLRGREPRDDRERRRLLRALIAKGHSPSAAAAALGIEWDGDDAFEDG